MEMKYLDYFKKRLKKAFKDEEVRIANDGIEFADGEVFYFNFREYEDTLNNKNYIAIIHEAVRNIKYERHNNKVDTYKLDKLKEIQEAVSDKYKSIQLLEGENNDSLIFKTFNNQNYLVSLRKGVIDKDDFVETCKNNIIPGIDEKIENILQEANIE